ncbi:MAG: sulfite exporter TauE/SafE family protein [Proteobacteria bacterium]|nr:sulfite exporter TauE/SafE family protein [Pseudomonadota bacterium]
MQGKPARRRIDRDHNATAAGSVTIADILAIVSGGAVGLVLALIGGGGSILATPALLYLVGMSDAHAAIGTSALAVSVNAFANLIQHARRGHVMWRYGAIFAAAGVVGAAAGAGLGQRTDARVLLPLFALLMIAVGVFMLRRKSGGDEAIPRFEPHKVGRLIATGASVGAISGFFGIGGGFLIVPGLVGATAMSMIQAIGTSLLSVSAFGATTASSYAIAGLIDWRVAALFIGGGVAGGMLGSTFAARLSKQRGALQRIFAGVVFAVAAYMLYRSLR